jgi:hypothetical protein
MTAASNGEGPIPWRAEYRAFCDAPGVTVHPEMTNKLIDAYGGVTKVVTFGWATTRPERYI